MIRLDVGLPRSRWFALLGCLLPCLVLAELVLAAISVMFIGWEAGMEVPGVLFLVFLVVANSIVAVSLARHYGNAFWLDGRVLIRRSVTGRRH
ncbi:hypothetical protein SAMN04489712_13844 [Thermomonospora echinospora]|uniref:Transmembrane protein n=1 Tax=Thermomonospora echinospora TaxID=1992 RepID=A0A1H6E818_9ACTN|nr:hypothetical protein [Thermomonospora echinospora]SEG93401.1 hypothetical protein SAMN04489712_13844 [Thermomonospora echinospora]